MNDSVRTVLLLLLLFFSRSAECQVIFEKPMSARQTGYKINARLDIDTRKVSGDMTAFWVNLSNDNVSTVQLHMYLNAFRNNNSTFNRESFKSSVSSDSGYIDITRITDRNGIDLSGRMQFISPDDGNPDDKTVLEINLPQSCSMGDTIFLNISFISKLPGKILRTGISGDFCFAAQWFPKFGVYETAGMRYAVKNGWNCHQFHRDSEFYSNHSVYEVSLTLPESYVVGSGGILVNKSDNRDGTKTMIYRAEDIVDFAWTAWPDYAVYNDQWKHVKIQLLIPADRKEQVARQMQAMKNALEYFEDHVGPYPWPYVTVVDPPSKGASAGGMEYTTIFTSQSTFWMPGFIKFPELVTIHEFGHAYFMGILASNEFEEPWLDEGVNTYWEERIIDHYYTGLIDYPLPNIPDKSLARMSYVSSNSRQVVSNRANSWSYPHLTYGMMSYQKTSVIFQTLEGIIGEELMDKAFREYYRKWAFKHPSGRDLINTFNEVVTGSTGNLHGTDLNWFFNQTLYGDEICDYRVSGIRNIKVETDSSYRSVAELERTGGIKLPVEVLVHFDNGDEVREKWDGLNRYKDFEYSGKRKIDWVKIDPDFKIKMDINYINNSMTIEPDNLPLKLMRNKLLIILQFILNFISL